MEWNSKEDNSSFFRLLS